MTALDTSNPNDQQFQEWERNHRNGRIAGGILLIIAGILFWFKKAGLIEIPRWIFSWQMLLIIIGLISGIKHNFKNATWLILISIGGIFLLADFIPGLNLRFYTFPAVLIIIGVVMILKPKNKHHYYHRYKYRRGHWEQCGTNPNDPVFNTTDEYLSINNVFGGVKKNVISKDFKGGEINNTFGGCEINLMQADVLNEVVLDMNVTFGGVKLLVPPHWQIKSDLTTVMGGVEDKRPAVGTAAGSFQPSKVLVLKGNVFIGGIEIKSY